MEGLWAEPYYVSQVWLFWSPRFTYQRHMPRRGSHSVLASAGPRRFTSRRTTTITGSRRIVCGWDTATAGYRVTGCNARGGNASNGGATAITGAKAGALRDASTR